jgi:CTP:molybdopterin cytidylyltransferase MocA
MAASAWRVVILAASRGPNDPMAKAYGVQHKCGLPVAGKPMLRRVVDALLEAGLQKPFLVSIEDSQAAQTACGEHASAIEVVPPRSTAASSANQAIVKHAHFPVLVTTGDHALLTPDMINHAIKQAETSGADALAALATANVITREYPDTRRTYFNLGGTRVSGCNIFAITTAQGLKLVETWETIERDRKKPWRLVSRFGLKPLFFLILGRLTPDVAFKMISDKIGAKVAPIFMPYAEAAIDVDKPSDLELAEKILRQRENVSGPAGNKLPR